MRNSPPPISTAAPSGATWATRRGRSRISTRRSSSIPTAGTISAIAASSRPRRATMRAPRRISTRRSGLIRRTRLPATTAVSRGSRSTAFRRRCRTAMRRCGSCPRGPTGARPAASPICGWAEPIRHSPISRPRSGPTLRTPGRSMGAASRSAGRAGRRTAPPRTISRLHLRSIRPLPEPSRVTASNDPPRRAAPVQTNVTCPLAAAAPHCHIEPKQVPIWAKNRHRRGRPLRSTCRQFLLAASFTGGGFEWLHEGAHAQSVAEAELMQPGPLGEQAMGADNAPVTIIEYASMTCPHCANFAINTFPQIKEKYIDTGKVRYILREFPFDPIAAGAFMLARCAGKDKYFAVVDLLFRTQRTWAVDHPLEPLLATVKQAGFTEESFKACLANQKVLDGIEWVRNRGAEKFKVDSTPTFFINGTIHKGAMSFEEMEKVIQPLLKA